MKDVWEIEGDVIDVYTKNEGKNNETKNLLVYYKDEKKEKENYVEIGFFGESKSLLDKIEKGQKVLVKYLLIGKYITITEEQVNKAKQTNPSTKMKVGDKRYFLSIRGFEVHIVYRINRDNKEELNNSEEDICP